MKLRFWGTRGGVASPSLENQDLGGNTTCIEVELSTGKSIMIDMGTGVIEYARQATSDKSEFHFLLTHFHWDHIPFHLLNFFLHPHIHDKHISFPP